MDGVHDLGGMDNFGDVEREANEPVFHAPWERSVFTHVLALLAAGHYNIDEFRRTNERISPVQYLASSYYERWLTALIALLEEKGVVNREELLAGKSLDPGSTRLPALDKGKARYITSNPVSTLQECSSAPRYKVGDEVVAKVMYPAHHTRLPRYVRGRRGTVEKNNGAFLLPDRQAHGAPAKPAFNYSVRFSARELWGEDAPAKDSLFIDLYESYLEEG
jgi:nitrile hydratase